MKRFWHIDAEAIAQVKWIYKFTKGDRLMYALMTLCDCFTSVCYCIYALISRDLIDAAIARDVRVLTAKALLLIAVVLGRVAVNAFSSWIGTNMAVRWEMRIRQTVFNAILKKDEKSVNKHHSAAMLDRIFTDASKVAGIAVNSITDVMSMFAGLAAAMASLFWINTVLPTIIIIAGIAFVFFRRLFKDRIKNNYMRVRQVEGERRSYYQEALENLLILKIFRAGDKAASRAKSFDDKCFKTWRISFGYRMLLSNGMRLFFSLGELGSLVFCSFYMMNGTISYGSLTAMIQLIAQLQSPFTWVFDQVSAFTAMTASAQRLMELEQLPETEPGEVLDAKKTYENMKGISFNGVSFGYEGGRRVFENAYASVQKGEFVMISGASGIGKSTLLKLLLSVYKPDSGEIKIELDSGDSVPVDASARSLFAYVPQGNLLFSGTIRDNLTFLCGERSDEQINRAIELACASGFVAQTPNGLDTVLEEGGRGLSEGQAQRLAIARAILCDAPILLLDEATSALDADTENELLKNLKNLDRRTVLFITHRKTALSICDREWHLDNGGLYERELKFS